MPTRTNSEWCDAFAAYLSRRFPDRTTAKHYLSDVQIFLRFQPKPLPAVLRADIDAFIDAERARGCSPATVKRRAATLATFFAFLAVELAEPERPNPVIFRRHAGKQPRLLPRDLADHEVTAFLAVITDVRDVAMVSLMLYAGLRVGEVAALHLADLTVPDDSNELVRLRVLGKGRKERIVYLVRHGYAPLHDYLHAAPPATPTAPLFRSRLGGAVTVAGIAERVRQYAERCGVAVTCHRLRHTYGRWMAEGDMPVLTLSRLLGHASIQTTQRYIAGADPQVRRGYEAAMRQQTMAPPPDPSWDVRPPPPETTAVTVTRRYVEPPDGHDWVPEAPVGVRQGTLAWLQHHVTQWKPARRRTHALKRLRELSVFWRWQLERRPFTHWAELTTNDIAAFMDAELARGMQAKTVKASIDQVYAVLTYLAGCGELHTVPRRPPLTLPEPLPRHLAPGDVRVIEATLEAQVRSGAARAHLHQALYYLLCHGGLRICEALELQMQDLDLHARRLRVREGKGRRDRVVYLSEPAVKALAAYLATVPHAAGDLVLSRAGQPLGYSGAWERIRAVGQAAGVPGVSPHRLRHTYATQLLNHGMSLEGLRCLMGHENLQTTLIYARLADDTLEQQYRAAMALVSKQEE